MSESKNRNVHTENHGCNYHLHNSATVNLEHLRLVRQDSRADWLRACSWFERECIKRGGQLSNK